MRRRTASLAFTCSSLAENFPNSLGFTTEVSDWSDSTGRWICFGKTMNAVLLGTFTSCDTRPEHGREGRLERGKIPPNAIID